MKVRLPVVGFALLACTEAPVMSPSTGESVVPITAVVRDVPGFFSAWSWQGEALTKPILTQPYDVSQCWNAPGNPCLDDAVYRQQWNNIWDIAPVATWAQAHHGHLYILGDAVHDSGGFGGLYMHDPERFAGDYCRFVREVRARDPTSEFSPGLIEPWATREWLDGLASGLQTAYGRGDCSTHPVAEWEFNFYPKWSAGLEGFQSSVGVRVDWVASLPEPIGAPVVLSSWTVAWKGDDVPNGDSVAYADRLREAKAWIFAHPKIIHARYGAYRPWPTDTPDPHPLADANGVLNASGRVYAQVTGRIDGPRAVRPNSNCSWTVATAGGQGPFSYKWIKGAETVSLDAGVRVVHPDAGFVLEMTVTEAGGGYSTAKAGVAVNEAAPPCT